MAGREHARKCRTAFAGFAAFAFTTIAALSCTRSVPNPPADRVAKPAATPPEIPAVSLAPNAVEVPPEQVAELVEYIVAQVRVHKLGVIDTDDRNNLDKMYPGFTPDSQRVSPYRQTVAVPDGHGRTVNVTMPSAIAARGVQYVLVCGDEPPLVLALLTGEFDPSAPRVWARRSEGRPIPVVRVTPGMMARVRTAQREFATPGVAR